MCLPSLAPGRNAEKGAPKTGHCVIDVERCQALVVGLVMILSTPPCQEPRRVPDSSCPQLRSLYGPSCPPQPALRPMRAVRPARSEGLGDLPHGHRHKSGSSGAPAGHRERPPLPHLLSALPSSASISPPQCRLRRAGAGEGCLLRLRGWDALQACSKEARQGLLGVPERGDGPPL